MSFVYARKYTIEYEGGKLNSTDIYSDTKISLIGANKANWSEMTRKNIEKYGLIKSVILNPKCCISFAGNNIAYAHELLYKLYEKHELSEDALINLAFDIHLSAGENEIEFIICLAHDNNETEIICIKDKKLYRNCTVAWIGSFYAFRSLREYETNNKHNNNFLDAFKYAVERCGDNSVGGFNIVVKFNDLNAKFKYGERIESVCERTQKVLSGELIKIFGSAEEGGYTACYHESCDEVIINLAQANVSIIYTQKYRLHDDDILNTNTKCFLLPIIVDSKTGKVL